MNFVQTVTALTPIDSRNIFRDPLLKWIVFFALLTGAFVRWGIPPLTVFLQQRYQFDLTPYHVLIISGSLLAVPVMLGSVVGFLLLDQKDDRTLDALRVTPMTVSAYLGYRVFMPMLISAILTFVTISLADFVGVKTTLLLITSIASAPLASIMALALACFAANKVQGFAMSKGSGVITMPPIFAFFVDSSWQLAFGVVPTFWFCKAFWMGAAGQAYVGYLIVALLFQALLIVWLVSRFQRVISR